MLTPTDRWKIRAESFCLMWLENVKQANWTAELHMVQRDVVMIGKFIEDLVPAAAWASIKPAFDHVHAQATAALNKCARPGRIPKPSTAVVQTSALSRSSRPAPGA